MQFNIVRYYINNYRKCGRISIRCCIHKRHPIPRPNGWAMGVSFVNNCEKIDSVITAPRCIIFLMLQLDLYSRIGLFQYKDDFLILMTSHHKPKKVTTPSNFYCYPRPVLAFRYCRCLRLCVCVCVCLCVCLCVNHEFVPGITLQPSKLESPHLEHRCKTPWLRSILFWGVIDLDLQGQI